MKSNKKILKYEELKFEKGTGTGTYNSQKIKGTPYKTTGKGKVGIYKCNRVDNNNKGTRHPHSILKYKNPHKTIHQTQKPVDLLEWLIKTYSNEGETILDFTMGSGSTGIACINTNRRFIGIEMDTDIFNLAINRVKEYYNGL